MEERKMKKILEFRKIDYLYQNLSFIEYDSINNKFKIYVKGDFIINKEKNKNTYLENENLEILLTQYYYHIKKLEKTKNIKLW